MNHGSQRDDSFMMRYAMRLINNSENRMQEGLESYPKAGGEFGFWDDSLLRDI